jgi:hypothetical protein
MLAYNTVPETTGAGEAICGNGRVRRRCGRVG